MARACSSLGAIVLGFGLVACPSRSDPTVQRAAVGPVVPIPQGKLIAGTSCGEIPRVPGEELRGEAVDMGAFDIDAYPFPNDPHALPAMGVSREDARKLCEARGRRLCTDLEWERACKGPANTRYEYGNDFDPRACPAEVEEAAPTYSRFNKCVSGYGVHALHGFAWEWTASSWKRGKDEGKGVLRGGKGTPAYAQMRCSAVREMDVGERGKDVGFRCCGGHATSKEVVIPAVVPAPAPLVDVGPLDDVLLGRLRHALAESKPADPAGATGKFTKAWRWHPGPREEFVLASYEIVTAQGASLFQPVVVHLCDASEHVVGRPLEFPVEELGSPAVSGDAPALATLKVAAWGRAGEAQLSYMFGEVVVDGPPWLRYRNKPKNYLPEISAPSAVPDK